MTKIKDDPRVHHRAAVEPEQAPEPEVKPKTQTKRSKASDTKAAPKSKRRS